MVVLIFTFGGGEVRDDESAANLANTIVGHGTKVGEDVSKVVLVTGKPWKKVLSEEELKPGGGGEDPGKKAGLVKKKLKDRGISDVEIVQVNQRDFKECLKKITGFCRKFQEDNEVVILNVTGGTREISFGAINAAWMLGLRAFHLQYKGKSSEIVELPIPTVKYLTKMSEEMKEYLVVLLIHKEHNNKGENEKTVLISNDIENARGVGSSTLCGAMNTLCSEGLVNKYRTCVIKTLINTSENGEVVKYEKRSRRLIYELTDRGELYAELAKREFEGTESGLKKISDISKTISLVTTKKCKQRTGKK